jgi:ribose transport system substrate-binding protein
MLKKMTRSIKYMKSEKILLLALITSLFFAFLITVLGMFYYKSKVNDIGLVNMENNTNYQQHYALISGNVDSFFWDSVYKGALNKGQSLDIYIEKFGNNLNLSHSTNELLEMAIAAKVDGIILEGNNEERTTKLINRAIAASIPVVTVLEDSSQSERNCFVGINNYNLGKKYGTQVLALADKDTTKVLVLLDSETTDTRQNIILSGIRETLSKEHFQTNSIFIDKESTFSAEEAIRNIIMDTKNLPDVLICLNSVDTICAYQAMVDFNKVGEIDIIGYYNSESVLSAIQKDIVYSTIVIDTEQMGAYCVEALDEYRKTKRISDYISVDTNLVSQKNINSHLIK